MKTTGKEHRRGNVYFVDFPHALGSGTTGTHPVVIVQNNVGNYHCGAIIGVVLTSSNKKAFLPTHVILNEPDSQLDGAMAMAEQIFTIDKQRLGRFVGRLSPTSMQRVEEAIRRSLALDGSAPELLCLCPTCRSAFENLPHHSVRRVDYSQQIKDVCTYCGQRMGYDYWVYDWSGLLRTASSDNEASID